MTCFSTIPDDCVQLIFDRIPVGCLFKVGRVSRAWRRHQLLNCRRRKTLILLQGRWNALSVIETSILNKPLMAHHINQNGNFLNHKPFFDYNRIYIYRTHKPMKVKVLVETFPNLEKLIVSVDDTHSPYLRSYIQLATSYPIKLVSLQLYFGDLLRSSTQKKSVSTIIGSFINQLNSMTVLQHFTFHSCWSVNSPIEAPEFITRLKEFYLVCGGLEKVMFEWLRKYDKAGRLNQLTKIYIPTDSPSMRLPSQFDHMPVTNCFTLFPYSEFYYAKEIDGEYMKRIVTNFPSLTTFKYTLGKINSLTKLANILSPLTKLVHISLTITIATPIEPLEQLSTAQQKYIKALDLEFPGCYDDCSVYENFLQSQVATIAHSFPNLQSIRITPDREYEYDKYGDDYEIVDKLKKLADQFLDDLKAAYGRSTLRTDYYA